MKFRSPATLATLLAACSEVPAPERGFGEPVTLQPTAVTPQIERGSASDAAFWLDRRAPQRSLILGAAGIAGLDIYNLDGTRAGNFAEVEASFVEVLEGFELEGQASPLVVVYDGRAAVLRAYRLDREALELRSVMARPLAIGDALTGLCSYRSRLSGSHYLYGATDQGLIQHWELYAEPGGVAGRLLRTIPAGKDSGYCAVAAREGALYFSEESVGLWRAGAEPESDTTRRPVDLASPWGRLGDEVKGIAIYPVDAGEAYLVAADVGEGRLVVYRLPDGSPVGTVIVEDLDEAEGIAATGIGLGNDYSGGLLAIADEDESGGGTDFKLLAWRSLAGPLGLRSAVAFTETGEQAPIVVRPSIETDPVNSYGDAADDVAIWVHPTDPAQSLVIGSQKKLGLHVFDLDGRTVQVLRDGRMNNVDLRYDFPLGGERVAIIAASNRSFDSLALYRVDAEARTLVEIADGRIATGMADPYGLCMYRSAATGEYYVFINDSIDGRVVQWRLFDNGGGRIAAEQVREFVVGSQAEGCSADDELDHLYIGEEDRGIWKYAAEPDGGEARTLVDGVGGGRLEADVEGVTIWHGADGSGYLVVSNQGMDNYAVYRREGDNAFVGHFRIVANAALGIDGVSETDGLDLTSAPLGAAFPQGLLVVQDGRNIDPAERQNFKYVSWAVIAAALGLEQASGTSR